MTSDPAAKDGSGHTKGPWVVKLLAPNAADIGPQSAGVVAHVARWANGVAGPEAENAANARRIVACVNYCEGVPTELLEGHPSDLKTVSDLAIRNGERADVLEADRDRLRERVKELEAVAQMFLEAFEGPACCEAKSAMGNDAMPELLRVGEIARAALSKSPK